MFFQHSVRHEEFVPFRRGKFGPADADFCSSATPVDDGVANQRPADDAGEDETAVRQQPQVQPLLEQHPAQSDPQFRILRLGFVAHVPVSHRTPLQRRISRSRRNRFRAALQFPQLGTKGNVHSSFNDLFTVSFTELSISRVVILLQKPMEIHPRERVSYF